MMDWGFAIPMEFVPDFLAGKVLRGISRKVDIIWDNKRYNAKLCMINRNKPNPLYQIRWDSNRELLKKIRKTFIQSYVILKSQKELFDATRRDRKHFRTQLEGGQQEVITFQPLNENEIRAEVFIQIENGWNALFQRLADENVFGWIFDRPDKQYLIQRSTHWYKATDFYKHQNVVNVIYYLAHSRKKLLYIGKAEVLGKRVKPGKIHQKMPGDWDRFKYDIIKPEFAGILERIEDHTIRSFASVLKNVKGYPSLEIGNYKLVNSNWKKL